MLDFLDVLNLVINGIPSILRLKDKFNSLFGIRVLNLVINGIPSILPKRNIWKRYEGQVLNLVINGIPSIHEDLVEMGFSWKLLTSFKPCYKWNTFNTRGRMVYNIRRASEVLNLVINGIPSILLLAVGTTLMLCVLNLVINGIPSIQSIDW